MLKFIGRGSAFNTEEGSNSAYFIYGKEIILIDCGTETFKRLNESGILKEFTNIRVLVTHTHDDHVGSLASLILYNYFCMGEMKEKNIWVYSPYDIKLKDVLHKAGCSTEYYHPRNFDNNIDMKFEDYEDIEIVAVPQKHVEEILSYGYVIEVDGKTIYYSGDTCLLPWFVKKPTIINKFDYIYQDTSWLHYEGNVHLSLANLVNAVPDMKLRERIYCMHLDHGMILNEVHVKSLGLNMVEVEECFKSGM
ncbi:hydrolase [Bacillus phage Tomato]|nr:hydrolase [Bacillus phage Tomato]